MLATIQWDSFSLSAKLKHHVQLLINAIINVKKDYLWYNDYLPKKCTEVNSSKRYEHLERVFAYELYHQWSILLAKDRCGLTLNAEITKEIFDNEKNTHVFPDFVLHNGQGNDSEQILVCEVKRRQGLNSNGIKNDIDVLIDYLDNKKFSHEPFKLGIFILIGEEFEYLKEEIMKIHNIGDERWISFAERILCITYNYNSSLCKYSINVKHLSEIYNR